MAHDSIDALSVLRTCTYCDSSALATDVPAACYTAYLQGCLPPLSRELTARSIFCRSSVNAPCHVFWACRCVFSRDEYDKTGRALYVAGGCRSNFSVWTGHGYPGKHKLHTTSCMHLWLACLGTRRTETDLLRRLAAWGTACVAVHGVSSWPQKSVEKCLDNDRYVLCFIYTTRLITPWMQIARRNHPGRG